MTEETRNTGRLIYWLKVGQELRFGEDAVTIRITETSRSKGAKICIEAPKETKIITSKNLQFGG